MSGCWCFDGLESAIFLELDGDVEACWNCPETANAEFSYEQRGNQERDRRRLQESWEPREVHAHRRRGGLANGARDRTGVKDRS